jgi:hypothetical protein
MNAYCHPVSFTLKRIEKVRQKELKGKLQNQASVSALLLRYKCKKEQNFRLSTQSTTVHSLPAGSIVWQNTFPSYSNVSHHFTFK